MAEIYQSSGVDGYLHEAQGQKSGGLVITHGAGGNCKMPLLVAAAEAFSQAGYTVLRCNLAFRQKRASGSPHPSGAAADRESLRIAVEAMRTMMTGRVILGGQSYGGRQATMLAAEQPDVADGLLLFSYPLHPPGKPEQLRTAHFPALRTASVFVSGTKDPFGTVEEMEKAIQAIPAAKQLIVIEKAGHDLARGKFDMGRAITAVAGPTV